MQLNPLLKTSVTYGGDYTLVNYELSGFQLVLQQVQVTV